MIKRAVTFVLLAFSLGPAWSQTADLQGWAGFEMKRDLRKGFDLSVQAQTRWENNVQQFKGNYISISPNYKLKKNLFLLGETRYGTSKSWDKFRFGLGLEGKEKIGKVDFSLKFKYQHEFFLQAWPEIGQNPAKNNFRLKLSADYKLIKKVHLGLSVEPVYQLEAHVASMNFVRNTVQLKWEFHKRQFLELSYFYQPTWSVSRIDKNHIVAFNYVWELKKQKKKKKPNGVEEAQEPDELE